MSRKLYVFVLFGALLAAASTTGSAQQSSYPMIDKLSNKVIAHYQESSCQDLAAQRQAPKSQQKSMEEQRAVQYLRQNPQAAQYFLNKVAAPIANKMFECGMIP